MPHFMPDVPAGCRGHPAALLLLLLPHPGTGQECPVQNGFFGPGVFLQVPPDGAGRAH